VRFERRVPVVNVSYTDVSMYVLFSRLTSNGIPVEKTTILGGKICLYMYKARRELFSLLILLYVKHF
jgi:hypothetical protein